MLAKETHEHVIRVAPPLTITGEELDWAIERMERLKAAQAGLERPKQLGQSIGIRRKA